MIAPSLIEQYYRKPAFFGVSQWFNQQSFKIPHDVVKNTQMLAVGASSMVGSFYATASNGAGRAIHFSNKRPIVGNLAEALGGVDSDVVITQTNWWNYGSNKFGAAGKQVDTELLFPAEVVAYPYIPGYFSPERVSYIDSWDPSLVATVDNVAYEVAAIIPIHKFSRCALAIKNNSGVGLSWFVEQANLYSNKDSGIGAIGAGARIQNLVIDPYNGPSNNGSPVIANSLPTGNVDSRTFTNLAGHYLLVKFRAASAGVIWSANYQVEWEVTD